MNEWCNNIGSWKANIQRVEVSEETRVVCDAKIHDNNFFFFFFQPSTREGRRAPLFLISVENEVPFGVFLRGKEFFLFHMLAHFRHNFLIFIRTVELKKQRLDRHSRFGRSQATASTTERG